MIEDLIKELSELLEYKNKYEYLQKDKQKMSDALFQYATKEYEKKSYTDRCEEYRKNSCNCCRYEEYCTLKNNLQEDIGKPAPSDKAWFPKIKTCGEFDWR